MGFHEETTDNFFIELFYLPPEGIPDVKIKYTVDKDFDEGVTDTVKQGVALSSVYIPNSWLNLKGDYVKNQWMTS